MENKKDYIFKKITDWVFRKKSILYLLVMVLFREFTAIGVTNTLIKWETDPALQDVYLHYPIMALNFLFAGGNWTIIWILVGLIVLFKISEWIEAYFNSKKDFKEKSRGQTIINNGDIEKQVNIDTVEKLII